MLFITCEAKELKNWTLRKNSENHKVNVNVLRSARSALMASGYAVAESKKGCNIKKFPSPFARNKTIVSIFTAK